jgi:DNA-binding transcriptional MocR family regulator
MVIITLLQLTLLLSTSFRFLPFFCYAFHDKGSSSFGFLKRMTRHEGSKRVIEADEPHIENILDKYSSLKNISSLALGSSYWSPPSQALSQLFQNSTIEDKCIHKYGNILGMPELIDAIKLNLAKKGLDTRNLSTAVTAGANQAFVNLALALCDDSDDAVVIAPFYFSHKMALQFAGAKVHICPFDRNTLMPDWAALSSLIANLQPKMVGRQAGRHLCSRFHCYNTKHLLIFLLEGCGDYSEQSLWLCLE